MTAAAAALAELVELERFLTASAARQAMGDHICMAAQPETANGSPEVLIEDGVAAGARITGGWGDQVLAALEGRGTEFEIRVALQRVAAELDAQALAKQTEQLILRSLMLGALDSVWEREHDEDIAPAKFADRRDPQFVYAPFTEAVLQFEQRQVLPPAAYAALEDGARRRAFTVARLAKQELLDATHAELLRQLREGQAGAATGEARGANLRDFKRFAKERLESAGWTPSNPSHVETIYRTNAMSALSAGRVTEMSQPAVIAALPYWQVRTVKDARQRPTHRAADGIVLPANHPFWLHAYPPWGFNCRCRVCARTRAWVERMGVSADKVPVGLPDPGFESGTRALISVPPASLQPAPLARPSVPVRAPVPVLQPAQRDLPFANEPVSLQPPMRGPRQLFPIPPPPPPPMRPKQAALEARAIYFGKTGDSVPYERAQATAQQLFGKPLDAHLVERLTGGGRVPGASLTRVVESRGGLTLSSTYTTLAGEESVVIRKFYRTKAGDLEVEHALFAMDKRLQGRGVAKAVLRDQVLEYQRLGVKRIEMTAAWTGRYTWPRMGFEFTGTEKQFRAVRDAFARHLSGLYGKEAAAKITDRITNLRDLVLVDVEGEPPAKRFFDEVYDKGTMLPMQLHLDRGDANFKLVAHYLGI